MPNAAIPFDTARLDSLMDEAGIDVLIATSKHNVQYLLGGHRAFFFDYMDAMGLSRYLPVMVYAKGAPDKAAYFGHRLENFQREEPSVLDAGCSSATSSGSIDTMQKAIEHIQSPACKTAAHRRRDVVPAGRCRQRRLQDAFPDAALVGCAVRAGAPCARSRRRRSLQKLKHRLRCA